MFVFVDGSNTRQGIVSVEKSMAWGLTAHTTLVIGGERCGRCALPSYVVSKGLFDFTVDRVKTWREF